jgi:hypothetical protein
VIDKNRIRILAKQRGYVAEGTTCSTCGDPILGNEGCTNEQCEDSPMYNGSESGDEGEAREVCAKP